MDPQRRGDSLNQLNVVVMTSEESRRLCPRARHSLDNLGCCVKNPSPVLLRVFERPIDVRKVCASLGRVRSQITKSRTSDFACT